MRTTLMPKVPPLFESIFIGRHRPSSTRGRLSRRRALIHPVLSCNRERKLFAIINIPRDRDVEPSCAETTALRKTFL